MRFTFVAACVGFYASALEIKDDGLLPLVNSGNPYPTEMAQIEIQGREKGSFGADVEKISADEDEGIDSTARDQGSPRGRRLVPNEKITPQGRGVLDRLSDYKDVAK